MPLAWLLQFCDCEIIVLFKQGIMAWLLTGLPIIEKIFHLSNFRDTKIETSETIQYFIMFIYIVFNKPGSVTEQ